MSYIIYNKATTRIQGRTYKTHAAAKAALTRMGRGLIENQDHPKFLYAIAEINYYYENIERKVVKQNLMTGADYEESVNTPLHMSPSSETYWSM